MYITGLLKEHVNSFRFSDTRLKYFKSYEYEYTHSEITSVNLNRVVGTTHPDYAGKTWSILYPCDDEKGTHYLKRGSSVLAKLKDNPDYYLSSKEKNHWGFCVLDGELYINGGVHRTVIAKYFLEANQLEPIVHGVEVSYYTRKIPERPSDEEGWGNTVGSCQKFLLGLTVAALLYFTFF